jgi:hypothetical protein
MRAVLIEQLAAQIEGGSLALLSNVGGALAAIDAMRTERMPETVAEEAGAA